MITDRIGLHKVLLPLLIKAEFKKDGKHQFNVVAVYSG